MSQSPWVPRLGHPTDPSHKFNRQWDIFNTRKRIVLVSGSRLSGKTVACLHRICRHLWETPNARVAMFAKSKGLAKDGGSWQQLLQRAIPEWIESGIGFHFTTMSGPNEPGPKTDNTSKTPYFSVRNHYGGESDCLLFSIDDENEIADKVKNKEFSMMYFIELSMFKNARLLPITLSQLRMPHLNPPTGQKDTWHQWIADTNPDEDLGNRSWFFNTFYTQRALASTRLKDETDIDYQERQEYYEDMEVIEMFWPDNPFISRQQIITLKMSCRDDEALMDSHVRGIHGDAGAKRTRHFASLFTKQNHIIQVGENQSPAMFINPSTTTLVSGWDIGASQNHAAGVVDKWRTMLNGRSIACFTIIAEHVALGEHVKVMDFASALYEKMRELDKTNRVKYDWIHWSDDTAVNVYRPTSGTFDYLEVMAGTNGRVVLQGANQAKAAGMVRFRVQLVRRLLRENRLFALSTCPIAIEMFEEAKQGTNEAAYVEHPHKHSFDWISYILFMEMLGELQDENNNPTESQVAEIIGVG